MKPGTALQKFLETVDDAVMVTEAAPLDEPGPVIEFVNPAFERMTGYSVSEAIGRSPRFLQGPRTQRESLSRIRAALADRRPVKVDLVNYRRDGSEFWNSLSIYPIFDRHRVCRHFVGVLRDITDQKHAEERLQDSEARFRVVTELLPMAVAITRRSDGKVLYGNPWLSRFFGVEPGRLEEHSITELYADLGDRERLLRELDAHGVVADREIAGHRPDGTPAVAFVSARLMTYRGEEAVLVVGTDISERKKLELDLRDAEQRARQAQRAAEAAALGRSRFFAAASHDLRQPYQAMRLFLQLLVDQLTEPGQREVAAKLTEAMDAGERLLKAMLDVSALDAGIIQPKRIDFPLREFLARIAGEFEEQAKAVGLRFRWFICKVTVHSDPLLLQRIVSNLLTNALRYTPEGGILLGCRRRGNAVRIEVWDTGIGIPLDSTDRIFEDFVQLGNVERDREKGLGLGLSIVSRVANLLGHRLSVRSTLGRGSMFAVEVPMAEPEKQIADDDRERPPPQAAAGGEGSVLVIDDDPIVLESLARILGAWGLDVLPARSLYDVSSRLSETRDPPSLIIADYRIGGGATGADAIDLIRQHYQHAIPALVLTGDTQPERLREASARGHVLLHKPVDAASLRQAVDRALASA